MTAFKLSSKPLAARLGLTAADIARWLPHAWHELRSDGRLWICYRKGRKSYSRDDVGAAVDATGLDLTWFRQTAIDSIWSAIWFKHRADFRTLNH